MLIENKVTLLRGIIRTSKCNIESSTQEELREDSQILPWLVGTRRWYLVEVSERSRLANTIREIAWRKKTSQEFAPFGEKVLARQISTVPMNRLNPRYKFGIWLGTRNNGRMFHWRCRRCVLWLVKSEDRHRRAGGTKRPSTV